MWIDLLQCIGKDLLNAAAFLPVGIGAGAFWLVIDFLISRSNPDRKQNAQRRILVFLMIAYMTVLLEFAFFSREPGSRTGVDLELFETWGKSTQSHSYFIENVIMFLPFGNLFPMTIRKFRHARVCVAAGMTCSVCLELAQLLTGRGFCQLDDVVTNTFGTFLGWLIWKGGSRIWALVFG